jgi:hypothetical protein
MKNELLKEIKTLEQTIYISEMEKVSDKIMTNLRNKLIRLQKQAEND